ncbi:Uncharacterised protein [Escherichia coli]|nr:Uncharacterised protein [Escherichia coli]
MRPVAFGRWQAGFWLRQVFCLRRALTAARDANAFPQRERKQEIGAVIVIDNGGEFDVLITLRIEQQLWLIFWITTPVAAA